MTDPMAVKELFRLDAAGVTPDCFTPEGLAIASSRGACACSVGPTSSTLTLVSFPDFVSHSLPIQANAVLQSAANPNIIVLRTPTMLQTLDIVTKTPYGRYEFPAPIAVDYWAWASETRVALVCPDAVYFWDSMSGAFTPGFARDQSLTSTYASSRIVDFSLSADGLWATVTALGVDQTQHPQGMVQLHNFSTQQSRVLSGQAARVLNYQIDADHSPTTLLVVAVKPTGATEMSVTLTDLGQSPESTGVSTSGIVSTTLNVPLLPGLVASDYPAFVRVPPKLGLLYLFTKGGTLSILDLSTGTTIYTKGSGLGSLVTLGPCPADAPYAEEYEFLGGTAEGVILGIGVDREHFLEHVAVTFNRPDFTYALALRTGLHGADSLFTQQFDGLFESQQWQAAVNVVKRAPPGCLRTDETLKRFKAASATFGASPQSPLAIYLGALTEDGGKLVTPAESIALAGLFIEMQNTPAIESYLKQKQFYECVELADFLQQNNLERLAFQVYANAGKHEKAVAWLITQNQYSIIPQYRQKFPDYKPDYPSIIQQASVQALASPNPAEALEAVVQFALSLTQGMSPDADADTILDIAEVFQSLNRIKDATAILMDACRRFNFGEPTLAFQLKLVEMNEELDPEVVKTVRSYGVVDQVNRGILSKKSESEGQYQRAFDYADNDTECRRIAATYTPRIGRSIFASPEWYANYIRRAHRFQDTDEATVRALFAFQQQMLEITLGGERVYAEHVAIAFARSPVVNTNPSLCVTVVKVFEKYELGNSEYVYIFLSNVTPVCPDPTVHGLLLKVCLPSEKHCPEVLDMVKEDQCLDPKDAFDTLTTVPAASPDLLIASLHALCFRFELGAELATFLCGEIKKKGIGKDTLFTLNAVLIIERYLTSFSPGETDAVLAALFAGGVMAEPPVGPIDSVFTPGILTRIISDPAVQAGCNLDRVTEVCLVNSKTVKVARTLLETRLASGASDKHTHTAFAKVLMDMHSGDAEKLISSDPYLDYASIGEFVLGSSVRRVDTYLVELALQALEVGAFGIRMENQDIGALIIDGGCAMTYVYLAYSSASYKKLALALVTHHCSDFWQMALVTAMDGPTDPDLLSVITHDGKVSMPMHREMLLQAMMHDLGIPYSELNEAEIFALSSALLGIKDVEEAAPRCLQAVLEGILSSPMSPHAANMGLQNLLIVTAINNRDYTKVSAMIRATEPHYDPAVIAKVCIENASKAGYPPLYEEAFEAYRRTGRNTDAVMVLLENVGLERGANFATLINQPEVWALVGSAQLDAAVEESEKKDGRQATKSICDAIASFRAGNWIQDYQKLVLVAFRTAKAFEATCHVEVTTEISAVADYLLQARELAYKASQAQMQGEMDTALMYCYARLERYDDLRSFLESGAHPIEGQIPNRGDPRGVAKKCFSEDRYAAAQVLFEYESDWTDLTLTYVKLHRYTEAMEAARHAADKACWRAIVEGCIGERNFPLAASAAMELVWDESEVVQIVTFYERGNFVAELMEVLERGIEDPRAQVYTSLEGNIFTALSVVYCKYMWVARRRNADCLMNLIKAHGARISIPLVLTWAKEARMWGEAVYLLAASGEFNEALVEAIAHPPLSFDHTIVLKVAPHVSNAELIFRVAEFYLEYAPERFSEFLCQYQSAAIRGPHGVLLDPARIIGLARSNECIPMLIPYLEMLIDLNNEPVNNLLISLYLQSYNDEGLRRLISATAAFDTEALLERLTAEDQTAEMRKLAVCLYARLGRYDEGIQFGLRHEFYEDAAECAANSGNPEQAESLLRLVCSPEFPTPSIRKEVFAVVLIRCGSCLRSDVVLELAWSHRMLDFVMPYLIATMRRYGTSLNSLQTELDRCRAKGVF